jgi:spore coat polysaccharide biosynthesis protein SpsF
MKILAIIQARMGSTRLPGKVLADIHGRPMLRWLLDRIQSIKEISEIVVATTTNSEDDELEKWLNIEKVTCYRGSENDVLDRFFCCAEGRMADIIVRVTADDPLKDPALVSEAISVLTSSESVDYCSNSLNPTYPEGLDIEVFRYSALIRANKEALLPSEREHVTPYIWKNPEKFHLRSLEYSRNLSHWRWTVDKPEDLTFMRIIYNEFKNKPLVSFSEVIAFLDQNPKLVNINTGSTIRNEGYLKSISIEQL